MKLTDAEIVQGGYEQVDHAMTEYREGRSIAPGAARQLAGLLTRLRYRDHAWASMAPQHAPQYAVMWAEVAHAADPGQAAAPAMLLAYASWQQWDTSGAIEAANWAVSEVPGYRAAYMIATGVRLGVPVHAVMPVGTRAARLHYDDALAVLARQN